METPLSLKFLLEKMSEWKASDLFITIGVPPSVKINGKIQAIGDKRLTPDDLNHLLDHLLTKKQQEEFNQTNEATFAYQLPGVGRFRASVFMQRSQKGCVLRRIETKIPTFESLKASPTLKSLSALKKGLILLVGATGTGKSSMMAAMIGYRNEHSCGHILTIEDPVEFLHNHNRCIVTQREIGIDTGSYHVALRSALRQAPNVICIGEIRDTETMRYALTFADTGHLCISTLHATNAPQALERISNFFPSETRDQIWMNLSLNLRAIVAQQLVNSKDGKNYRLAQEILINTATIQDIIRRGEPHLLKEYMSKKNDYGMQTFDQSLFELYHHGEISYEEAITHAESPNDLRLLIKLNNNPGYFSGSSNSQKGFGKNLGLLGSD